MTDDESVSRRRVLRSAGVVGLGAVGAGAAASARGEADRGPRRSDRALAIDDDDGPDVFAGDDAPTCDRDRTDDDALPFDTNGDYGGWGGHEYHGTDEDEDADRAPVVFVHGNTDDACAFDPHAEAFLEGAYAGDGLWSITFREETTTHPEMADQLDGFVERVLEETGADAVDVVAHSLGVTGARYWMDEEDRYDDVETFVGLAGANHGTWVCGPGCEALPGRGEPCQFLSPSCADPGGPLHDLNSPDETPGDVDYYTIRGGLDLLFLQNRESPALEGAENVELEWRGHDAARESEAAIRLTYGWLRDG
ncbi:triacylglycerol lipase [Halovivax sp.]|uniref:esterase/lipase family protein n=1 Tax=Halovivax sp. TaxID=1935978 RepID=UPI0025BBBA34|nr:hypothetical protein [Halovivax sp.]